MFSYFQILEDVFARPERWPEFRGLTEAEITRRIMTADRKERGCRMAPRINTQKIFWVCMAVLVSALLISCAYGDMTASAGLAMCAGCF